MFFIELNCSALASTSRTGGKDDETDDSISISLTFAVACVISAALDDATDGNPISIVPWLQKFTLMLY